MSDSATLRGVRCQRTDNVFTKNIDTRIQSLALPTYFTDHLALLAIVSGIHDATTIVMSIITSHLRP